MSNIKKMDPQEEQRGSAATYLFSPTKQIRKAKLSAKRRILNGSKVREERLKVIEAFDKVKAWVEKYEPKTFQEIERKRRTGRARSLRKPRE